ncbi:HET-domain-containing protein [Xylariaceae sp. AK1471]|nr:HET-domain-containing protein [Xylariaceae sp. AK1471]
MDNLTQHGATLLGEHIGAFFNGVLGAVIALFFDWITPRWCKTAYVVFDHLYRARRSDNSLVTSKCSWRTRLATFAAWSGMCTAYLVWAPRRRLIMIYHGITGHGVNAVIWTLVNLQNDGPINAGYKVQSAFFEATCAFLVSSCSLTHRALVWRLVKWAFLKLGIPSLCIGAALYYFREQLSLASTCYRVYISTLVFGSKAWDQFDYVEAQVTERLPQYLQHKWSSYQQQRPERIKLPLYRYKPLNAGEIRLLVLKRSSCYPSVIQAELIHRPIYPPPDYEAVSYRWGSSELTEEALVDGCRFPVTKSAFNVLLARRSVWRERTIWIDQLCINQENLQEKSEQVQLMCDIYHHASRVIAYLGGDWQSRLAGPLIYELWALTYQYNTDEFGSAAFSAESKSQRWRAMADLFSNEYFNRTWIIQEIAVGQKTELYVGRMYIPWMIFAEVMLWCFQTQRRSLLTTSDDRDRRIWRNGRSFENIAVITTLRPEAEEWTGAVGSYSHIIDLENLLYLTFKFSAGDPRDKVFGLIGIAKSVGNAALITPDYSLSVEQVFENAARAILSFPPERRSVNILALAGTGFSEQPRTMPSWVPNFSEERLAYPYSDVINQETSFRASGDLPQSLELDNETKSLVFKAISIDQILDLSEFGVLDWGLHDKDLADIVGVARIMHRFVHAAIDLCRKHSDSPSAADEMISERLWSGLIIGRIERKLVDSNSEFKELFQHWLRNLDVVAMARDLSHYDQLIEEGALGDDSDSITAKANTTYSSAFKDGCFGRRIAITVYGRLCVVPPLTKAGDSVIIPLGAQTPFLIRKRHDRSENVSYELVGEAWVEGVMHGEMIGSTDEELIRIT